MVDCTRRMALGTTSMTLPTVLDENFTRNQVKVNSLVANKLLVPICHLVGVGIGMRPVLPSN